MVMIFKKKNNSHRGCIYLIQDTVNLEYFEILIQFEITVSFTSYFVMQS